MYAWLRRHPRLVDASWAVPSRSPWPGAFGGLARTFVPRHSSWAASSFFIIDAIVFAITVPVSSGGRTRSARSATAVVAGAMQVDLQPASQPAPVRPRSIVILLYTLAVLLDQAEFPDRAGGLPSLGSAMPKCSARYSCSPVRMAQSTGPGRCAILRLAFPVTSLIAWLLGDSTQLPPLLLRQSRGAGGPAGAGP